MGNFTVTVANGKAVLTRKGKGLTVVAPVQPQGTETVTPETPEQPSEEVVEESAKPGRRGREGS